MRSVKESAMVADPNELAGLLHPIASKLREGDPKRAAALADALFRRAENVAVEAWALALGGVAETRAGRFDVALDTLDAALDLARVGGLMRLYERIRIDRLVPLAIVQPDQLAEERSALRKRTSGDAELEALLSHIENRLPRMPPAPRLRLVTENLETEQSVHLERDPVRIGRKRGCDLQLSADGAVSRVHCEVVFRDDGWHVVDVSSRGNTRVEGCPSATGPLRPGARIQLGSTVLRVCA
jgi:hypothetical protein